MQQLSTSKQELIKNLCGVDDYKFLNSTGLENIFGMNILQLEENILDFFSIEQ